jgi:O-acetyl-ADP-ribose deacetylase (regulator of RNase III)
MFVKVKNMLKSMLMILLCFAVFSVVLAQNVSMSNESSSSDYYRIFLADLLSKSDDAELLALLMDNDELKDFDTSSNVLNSVIPPTSVARINATAKVNGTKIVITTDDIIQQKFDDPVHAAIVNAANERCLGGAGVDGAIHKAAGIGLLEECFSLPIVETRMVKSLASDLLANLFGNYDDDDDDEVKETNQLLRKIDVRCAVGKAVVTGSHNIALNPGGAHFVIHTVGPQEENAVLLRDAYWNTLLVAQQKGVKSIAFPSISTGIYGYPPRLAADVAFSTIKEFIQQYPAAFAEIRIVLFDKGSDYQSLLAAYLELAS